jgi:hypothetical protein
MYTSFVSTKGPRLTPHRQCHAKATGKPTPSLPQNLFLSEKGNEQPSNHPLFAKLMTTTSGRVRASTLPRGPSSSPSPQKKAGRRRAYRRACKLRTESLPLSTWLRLGLTRQQDLVPMGSLAFLGKKMGTSVSCKGAQIMVLWTLLDKA